MSNQHETVEVKLGYDESRNTYGRYGRYPNHEERSRSYADSLYPVCFRQNSGGYLVVP